MQNNMLLGSERQSMGVGDYTRFDLYRIAERRP